MDSSPHVAVRTVSVVVERFLTLLRRVLSFRTVNRIDIFNAVVETRIMCRAALARFSVSALVFVLLLACDASKTGAGAEVIPYSGVPLTAEDAVVTDATGERSWHAAREGDLVVLTRSELCGDECNETMKLTLRHRGDAVLPGLVELERIRETLLPERREEAELEVHRVEVQDWNLDGVVSGRVKGERTIVFWYEFAAEPDT